jgi:hypothetical protein
MLRQECPAGSACVAGATQPTPCAVGSAANASASSCYGCAAGAYQPGGGQAHLARPERPGTSHRYGATVRM